MRITQPMEAMFSCFHDREETYIFNKGISATKSEEGWSCKIAKRYDSDVEEEEDLDSEKVQIFVKQRTLPRSVQLPLTWFAYVEAFGMLSVPSLQGRDVERGPDLEIRKMLSGIDCQDIFRMIFGYIPGAIHWVVTEKMQLPVCTLDLGMMDTFNYEKEFSDGIEAARMWDLIGNDKNMNFAFMGMRCMNVAEFNLKKSNIDKFNNQYLQCEACGWLVKTTELVKCRAEIAEEEHKKMKWHSCCRFSCIHCTKNVHGSYVSTVCMALCDVCCNNTEVRKLTKLCDDQRWCDDCIRDGDCLKNHKKSTDPRRAVNCDACHKRRLFFSKRKLP